MLGTDYRYSNSGFCLLALIVGQASGDSFAHFVRTGLFDPPGMANAVEHVEGMGTVPNRACGNRFIDGRWRRTDQSNTRATLGGGGVYSTIDELARAAAALYDERLPSDASRHAMYAPKTKTFAPDVPYYGYARRIDGDVLWHSGETIGGRNVIVRNPKRHLSVVILGNRNDPEPYATAKAIMALFAR